MKSNVIWYFDFMQLMFNRWCSKSKSLILSFINIKPFRYSCFFKLSEWSWSGPWPTVLPLQQSRTILDLCVTWWCYRWSNRCSIIGTWHGNSRLWCGVRWWWSDRGSRFLPRAISGQLTTLATTLVRIFWSKSMQKYYFIFKIEKQ